LFDEKIALLRLLFENFKPVVANFQFVEIIIFMNSTLVQRPCDASIKSCWLLWQETKKESSSSSSEEDSSSEDEDDGKTKKDDKKPEAKKKVCYVLLH